MSLSKFTGEPILTIGFTHDYDKLHQEYGSTIRMGNKGLHVGDYVLLKHNRMERKVKITELYQSEIKDIPLDVLKSDIAPFTCESTAEFIELLQRFYKFEILETKAVWVIGWEVVKDV